MLHRVARSVIGIGLAAGLIAVPLFAQQPQKKVKDQEEYTLYTAVTKAKDDPNKQLQLLQTWKEKYPDSISRKTGRPWWPRIHRANLGKIG